MQQYLYLYVCESPGRCNTFNYMFLIVRQLKFHRRNLVKAGNNYVKSQEKHIYTYYA
jgi:hypothetical protein